MVRLKQSIEMMIEPEYDDNIWADLNQERIDFGMRCSWVADIGYIATCYHGGEGLQSSILWRAGREVLPFREKRSDWRPPDRMRSPISELLSALEVEKGNHYDEFDALGLGKYRHLDDLRREQHRELGNERSIARLTPQKDCEP